MAWAAGSRMVRRTVDRFSWLPSGCLDQQSAIISALLGLSVIAEYMVEGTKVDDGEGFPMDQVGGALQGVPVARLSGDHQGHPACGVMVDSQVCRVAGGGPLLPGWQHWIA